MPSRSTGGMAAPRMRLVHLADLHLGYRQFQRQTAAGINQREADVAAVFRTAVDKVIALRPDVVLIAGDVFHNVRPSNPAILHGFTQFSRLAAGLPDAIIVIVAGNHDTPRASETGCILRLFAPLGIHVVDAEPRRLAFPDKNLAILAVPDAPATRVALDPDPLFERNILLLHGEVKGVVPVSSADSERAALQIAPEELAAPRWSYVALGHYHVFRQVAPNAFYAGAIEYTSSNAWGELQEERAARLSGKGFIEFDLDRGRRVFHSLKPARALVDLPPIQARGLTAADVDAAIAGNVAQVPGGIGERIVRQVVRDIPRHVARELDHKTLREYKRHALHFHLDTRRPEIVRQSASGAPGRRPSLMETVRDKLRTRPLPADVDREALVALGLRYLRDADQLEHEALAATPERE
ncbi:MAG TPA: metallophosphoesterase [Gemmatimonadaceae bacterium]|nr:metallophosphoesterase [Gemmatimonadaceae bacterium]